MARGIGLGVVEQTNAHVCSMWWKGEKQQAGMLHEDKWRCAGRRESPSTAQARCEMVEREGWVGNVSHAHKMHVRNVPPSETSPSLSMVVRRMEKFSQTEWEAAEKVRGVCGQEPACTTG